MIVVDIETTGLDPQRHSLASIGALDYSCPSNRFYSECQVEPGMEIDPQALAINGFTEEQLRDPTKMTAHELVRRFIAWFEPIADRTFAGENPSFDLSFVRETAKRAGAEFHAGHRTVDLHTLCYSVHMVRGLALPLDKNRSRISLDYTLGFLSFEPEPKPHNALTGAVLEAKCFSELLRMLRAETQAA